MFMRSLLFCQYSYDELGYWSAGVVEYWSTAKCKIGITNFNLQCSEFSGQASAFGFHIY
jgi:hypothetical protein